MKRILALLLTVVMILPLAACGETQKSDAFRGESGAELERAISYGIVTEEELTNMDETVTYKQFCELLTNVVSMRGEKFVPAWKKVAEAALDSDEAMQRDDVLLTMFEAAMVMGIDHDEGQLDEWDESLAQGDWWAGRTMDYELFPNWQEAYTDADGNRDYSILDHSAWYFEKTPSLISGLFPIEPQMDMTYGFDKDVSFEEAVRALTRMVESNAKITAETPVYVPLSEVGTYDKSVITGELLSSDSKLPEVAHDSLPTEWKGAGLSSCKDGRHIYRHFRESDVVFLAENGFNFLRLFFGFDTLRFPDYPEDERMVNENELKELDRLIAWGIEHGVHIQISMSFYLDENGNCKTDESDNASGNMMPENDAEWDIINDYWTMLAKRYADIPSRYLTFDLSNEIQPDNRSLDYHAKKLSSMVSSIRSEDADRVLLHSFPGNPDSEWMEVTTSLGLAVGCHPYYPMNISTGDTGSGSGDYFEPCWPMPVLPAWKISTRQTPLTLQGKLSGAEVDIHVGKSGYDAALEVLADGRRVKLFNMPQPVWEENGECWYGEDMMTCSLPEGTSEVKIWVRKEDAHIDTVVVKDGDSSTTISFSSDEETDSEPLSVVLNGDGSYSNTAGTVMTGEEIYSKAIQPYRKIAEQNDVGFMVGEFGIFAEADWDINVVTSYYDTMMAMFEQNELGWCFCELYNSGTHLMLREGAVSQWANAAEADVKLDTLDTTDGPCRVVKELLDVFHKYTMD